MKVRGTIAGTPLSARLTALCWGALTLLAPVAVSACTSGIVHDATHGLLAVRDHGHRIGHDARLAPVPPPRPAVPRRPAAPRRPARPA